MQLRRTAAGLLALVLATALQAPASARGDERAAEILAAARKAIGDKKLDGLRTASIEATTERHVGNFQISASVEMLLELPDKYVRSDIMSGPMSAELRSGFNGDTSLRRGGQMAAGGAMMIRIGPGAPASDGPKPTPEQQEEMNRASVRSARMELSRLMLGWFAMAHPSVAPEYSYYGEAESPDGRADVIDVKGADGFEARLFIDQETRLPLMLTYQAPQPRMVTVGGPGGTPRARHGGSDAGEQRRRVEADLETRLEEMRTRPPQMAEHSLFFSDWKQVDGVMFPHRVTRSTGGNVTEEWTIDKVRVNPSIDAKKFAPQR